MNNWKIGAFYSEKTPYKEMIEKYLKSSCELLSLEKKLIVTKTTNYGNWYSNVAEKPNTILKTFSFLKEKEDLVFLDADSRIESYPKIFDEIPEEYDIAFHTLDWNVWYGYNHTKPIKELLTGTMFLRQNKKVIELCKEWYEVARKTREWEQKVLQRVIKNHDLKIFDLPIEYCYMDSLPGDRKPIVKVKPIIKHFQMSRKYKRSSWN